MKFKSLFKIALTVAAAIFVVSCSKDDDGITPDQETSKDKRELYDISFNGEEEGSDRFREVFEFVDSKGHAIEVADETTKKYRFREGLENWKYTTDASKLFEGFKTMTSVELPKDWGGVTDVSGLFWYCPSLKSITLPEDWGSITNASGMFWGCKKIESITLPKNWRKVTDTMKMFEFCSNLSHITLPSDWGEMTITDNTIMIGFTNMFWACPMLKTKAPGTKVSDSYYKSPSKYIFPEECYNEHLGLDF